MNYAEYLKWKHGKKTGQNYVKVIVPEILKHIEEYYGTGRSSIITVVRKEQASTIVAILEKLGFIVKRSDQCLPGSIDTMMEIGEDEVGLEIDFTMIYPSDYVPPEKTSLGSTISNIENIYYYYIERLLRQEIQPKSIIAESANFFILNWKFVDTVQLIEPRYIRQIIKIIQDDWYRLEREIRTDVITLARRDGVELNEGNIFIKLTCLSTVQLEIHIEILPFQESVRKLTTELTHNMTLLDKCKRALGLLK